MWAVVLTIRGGELTASVPSWLLNAAATYAVIDYGKEIAAELSRDPVAYGYRADNRYDVFANVWDAATNNIPVLAFGRSRTGQEAVRLIPDVYYLHSRGFRHVRADAETAPAWAERSSVVAWRGSVTGKGPYGAPSDIPRVRLTEICRTMPQTDVRLLGVHPTMSSVFDVATIEAHIGAGDLLGDRWPLYRFGRHRYVIDIDGHASAWGFLEKLILGCCVLKVGSPYEQWFYDDLRPWVHYVPVAQDLSDLHEKIEWCYANDERCRWIGGNAAAVAAALDYDSQLRRACRAFLGVAEVTST